MLSQKIVYKCNREQFNQILVDGLIIKIINKAFNEQDFIKIDIEIVKAYLQSLELVFDKIMEIEANQNILGYKYQ